MMPLRLQLKESSTITIRPFYTYAIEWHGEVKQLPLYSCIPVKAVIMEAIRVLKLQPSDCDQYYLYLKASGQRLRGDEIVPVDGYGANSLILQCKRPRRREFCEFIIASSQQQTQTVQSSVKRREHLLVTLHITFGDSARLPHSLSVPDSTLIQTVLDAYIKVKSMEASHE